VVLGCDVHPGGVKHIGPTKLNNILMTLRTQTDGNKFDKLLMAIAKNENDRVALKTLSMAFCYEPSNDDSESDSIPVYLYDKPTTLNEYLSEYALLDNSILMEKGPAFRVCKGFGTGQHKYLEFEGTHTCSTCACIVCHFCCITENHDTKCLGCLRAAVFGISNVSKSEMRETLLLYNVMVLTMASMVM